MLLDGLPADRRPLDGTGSDDAQYTAAGAGRARVCDCFHLPRRRDKPKGVSVGHRNVLHTLDAFRR